MSLQNSAEERGFPHTTAVQNFAARMIREAINDLRARYPQSRMIRRYPDRVQSHGYRPIEPAELAAERREFEADFISALDWIFGGDTGFEKLADSLRELDAELIRKGATEILERRRYATKKADRADYLPERLRARWRAHKRRRNFAQADGRRAA